MKDGGVMQGKKINSETVEIFHSGVAPFASVTSASFTSERWVVLQ